MPAAKIVWGAIAILVLFVSWWGATAVGVVSPFMLPSPPAVLEAAQRLNDGYLGSSLLAHLKASLYVVLTGYIAAALIGVPLGILMAWVRPLEILFGPLVSVLRPIPPPAWIPLAILWFGIDMSGKVFVVFLSAITPCLINAYVAIKEVPPHLISAARTLGADNSTLLFRVAIPSGLPMITSGLRIALGSAWATVVAAELVVATAGFGFVIMSGYRNFESDIMAVGIILVALIGFVMNVLFREIEKRTIPWGDLE
jgi:ABC-type nitrate/sulfonate/bicarbonate transport system permease component